MISAKPTPELKLGLIGYRDRGDDYVVKSFPMTDDIDAIYAHLRGFEAGGGGDTPESVNEALAEAIEKMSWSQDRSVLKIIFLVGDAPPHMDYADGPKYPELCRAAAKKDLIINTVQCGSMAETTPIWQEIAKLSEGSYAAIAQSGNMAVVATPMDEKLGELNKRMGATLIPYGDKDVRSGGRKTGLAEAALAAARGGRPAQLQRSNPESRARRGRIAGCAGQQWLARIPINTRGFREFQNNTARELEKAHRRKTRQDRAVVQKEIDELTKKRDAYLETENKRLAAAGKGDSFDEKVAQGGRANTKRKVEITRAVEISFLRRILDLLIGKLTREVGRASSPVPPEPKQCPPSPA